MSDIPARRPCSQSVKPAILEVACLLLLNLLGEKAGLPLFQSKTDSVLILTRGNRIERDRPSRCGWFFSNDRELNLQPKVGGCRTDRLDAAPSPRRHNPHGVSCSEAEQPWRRKGRGRL